MFVFSGLRMARKFTWIDMKKYTLLFILLILVSCATSRKKDLAKENSENSKIENIQKSQEEYIKYSSESQVDISQFMKESGLKITSTGNPFQLNYNGIVFSGDANIEFNSKEEKAVVKTYYRTETTYKSQTTYKSDTKVKQKSSKKNLNVVTKRNIFWLYVLIFLGGIAFTILIQQLWKRTKQSQWYLGILAKLK